MSLRISAKAHMPRRSMILSRWFNSTLKQLSPVAWGLALARENANVID